MDKSTEIHFLYFWANKQHLNSNYTMWVKRTDSSKSSDHNKSGDFPAYNHSQLGNFKTKMNSADNVGHLKQNTAFGLSFKNAVILFCMKYLCFYWFNISTSLSCC